MTNSYSKIYGAVFSFAKRRLDLSNSLPCKGKINGVSITDTEKACTGYLLYSNLKRFIDDHILSVRYFRNSILRAGIVLNYFRLVFYYTLNCVLGDI